MESILMEEVGIVAVRDQEKYLAKEDLNGTVI